MFNPGDKLLNNERFEIIEEVGRGGMGIVYKAHDTNLERFVAIKVLPPEVAGDRRSIRNLKHEAKTAAGLQHQNIVAIYDLHEWQGKHFIAMEFVEGLTLDCVVFDNFPLPIEKVFKIAIQICIGLQFIHDHQILHRDIKPKNIMITADETVKITDFGVAHIVKQTVTRMSGTTTGTMPYMAPEQFAAKPTDARSDIYAFGISLYEVLIDDLPFPGPDFAYQHREVKVESPTERRPNLNIPPSLSAIVMKCLAKNPADRYASVDQLLASLVELQQCLNDAGKIPELIQHARAHHTAKNYEEAIQIWQKILDVDSKNEDAQSGIARAKQGLTEQQAEKEKQSQVQSLFHQAQSEAAAGNYRKAIEISQQILKLDPDSKAAKSGIESASKSLEAERKREENRQNELAQQQKKREIREQIESLFHQAQSEAVAGNYQKVIEISQQILKLDPDNKAVKSGIENAQKILEEQQSNQNHLVSQAQDAQQTGNLKESIRIWRQILETDPKNQTAQSGLESAERSLQKQLRERDELIVQAQNEERKGDLKTAIQTWEKVLKIELDNETAKHGIAINRKILTEEEERERKKQELQAQRERQRQNQIQSSITYAQDEEKAGRLENAHNAWQGVLQIAPENKIAQSGLVRTEDLLKQRSTPKKIDYAIAASFVFIEHLHREGFDRGMIATFGDTFRIEQGFTSSTSNLKSALSRVSQTVNGMTRLYDSVEELIKQFWQYGDRTRPWLLTIITDGHDNKSQKYHQKPAEIGHYVSTNFMHQSSNFTFLIGVGEGNEIDANALAVFGNTGRFPAMTIAAFPLLEQLFLQIALNVSEHLVGRRIDVGNLSWAEVARIRQVSQVPLDYAFLIDRSSSMNSPG